MTEFLKFNYHFAAPGFFILFVLLVPIIVWYILRNKQSVPTLTISTLSFFNNKTGKWSNYLRHFLFSFRILVLVFVIFALARPQSTNNWQDVTTEGIDIMLSIDISGSMQAMDFKPNRMEASKDIAAEFINSRPNDRMGLVVFSGKSYTQCPLTTDHAVLINLFHGIKFGLLEDGTALGDGLATAVNRIKNSEAKSKVIILLTDGVNNAGAIAPITAAEIAKTFGIRVYTIGVGTLGEAPYPVQTPFGTQIQQMKVEIDEGVLKQIAQMTNGKYFRATNNNKLREIYKEIDSMEKNIIAVKEYHKKKEEFIPFLMVACILLLLEMLLRFTLLKKLP